MADYSYLTRSELFQMLMNQKNELVKQMVKTEPKDQPGKQTLLDTKANLEADITAIEAELKKTVTTTVAAAAPANVVANAESDQTMVKSLQEQATVQNLLDVIRNEPKMVLGDSMERFVAQMDQIYEVEVKDQVTELQKLEDEFVRATKRLLINTMYSQMAKSGEDTSTWELLKKYLIQNHGSKITMFQHLTRLWNLEPKSEEKLTDFAAKLEDQIHTASIHIKELYTKKHNADMSADDVFKLVGAMLTSIQVKKNHEDIFRSMIKKMDTHWTASSLAADAQDYIDRLDTASNITKTGAEVSFLAKSKNSKSSDQKKSSGKKSSEDESTKAYKELQKQIEAIPKAIQSLTLTNTSSKTGGRSGPSRSFNPDGKLKRKVNFKKDRRHQICWDYQRGACNGDKCPNDRRHVDEHTARAAIEEAVQGDQASNEQSNQLDALFQ